jgi:hypothetical protein
LDDFRQEVSGLLERALRGHKAEAIAAAVDRKRSTIYRWAAEPQDVPLDAIAALSQFDPDTDCLSRIAGLLMAIHSQRALARKAQERAAAAFYEIAPGKWVR